MESVLRFYCSPTYSMPKPKQVRLWIRLVNLFAVACDAKPLFQTQIINVTAVPQFLLTKFTAKSNLKFRFKEAAENTRAKRRDQV